jgi:hypothetical protein
MPTVYCGSALCAQSSLPRGCERSAKYVGLARFRRNASWRSCLPRRCRRLVTKGHRRHDRPIDPFASQFPRNGFASAPTAAHHDRMLALQSEVHGTHSLGGVTAILLLRCSLFSLRPEARVLPDFKTIYGTCLHGSGRGAAVRPRYKGLTPKAAVAGGPARTAGFRSSAPRLRDRDLLLDAEMEHEDSRRPPRQPRGGPRRRAVDDRRARHRPFGDAVARH